MKPFICSSFQIYRFMFIVSCYWLFVYLYFTHILPFIGVWCLHHLHPGEPPTSTSTPTIGSSPTPLHRPIDEAIWPPCFDDNTASSRGRHCGRASLLRRCSQRLRDALFTVVASGLGSGLAWLAQTHHQISRKFHILSCSGCISCLNDVSVTFDGETARCYRGDVPRTASKVDFCTCTWLLLEPGGIGGQRHHNEVLLQCRQSHSHRFLKQHL